MSPFLSEFRRFRIPLETIHKATNKFDERNVIGRGGSSTVYKGEFLYSQGPTIVAIKRWSVDGKTEFLSEIDFLYDQIHENVIQLLGFSDEEKERILVYEYAPNKSLDSYLADPKLTWVQRLNICLGAARGLEYLHLRYHKVLHHDIKSANILLDENWNAKIADIDFSEYGTTTVNGSYLFSLAKGSLEYVDPVFSETMIYTEKSDVYSFGVVLLEVLCSRLCIDNSYHDDDYRRYLLGWVKKSSKKVIRDEIIDSNLSQQMKEDSFNTFLKLALQCVEKKPKYRPSMDLIVRTLESALKYQECSPSTNKNQEKGIPLVQRFTKLNTALTTSAVVLTVMAVALVLIMLWPCEIKYKTILL